MEEKNDSTAVTTLNRDFQMGSVMQLRLDTTDILRKIEMYLRGQYETVEIKEGNPLIVVKDIGRSKANTLGVQSIMSWLTSLLNAQIVQGNIKTHEDHGVIVYEIAEDLTDYLYINSKLFGISNNEINGMIDNIMNNLRLFLSRLVGDGERKSFNNTIRTTETNSNSVRGKGIQMPFFG